jgi:hypothetical protein
MTSRFIGIPAKIHRDNIFLTLCDNWVSQFGHDAILEEFKEIERILPLADEKFVSAFVVFGTTQEAYFDLGFIEGRLKI